jgi:hypothetical protein
MNKHENIWTRQRRLQTEEERLLESMRDCFKGLGTALDTDDWKTGASYSDQLVGHCVRQAEIERELHDVNDLVSRFDQINERMERLEEAAKAEGWDGL